MFSQSQNFSRPIQGAVATAGVDERVMFLRRTYGHLFGAIVAFCGLEYMLVSFGNPLFENITLPMLKAMSGGQYTWLIFLGLFMAVGWIADKWARSDTSRGMQYAGLGLYVVAESILFAPMMFIAKTYHEGVIADAGIATGLLFAGLTATVFVTKKDFSFLRGVLGVGMMAALALIVASILFGFSLGMFFTIAMIAMASGYVLYYTSQVMAHYRPTQHVSAALALFSAVALLFWYILQLFMSRD